MLNAYIVDDERLAVQRLARLLQTSGRVQIAGSATDPEAALAFLQTHPVDVLFLDIQMPGQATKERPSATSELPDEPAHLPSICKS